MAYNEVNAGTIGLYTTVRNMVEQDQFFGFLPPHGRKLAAGEELNVFGDIKNYMMRFTPNDRARRSFESAVNLNKLAIVRSPDVILFDQDRDRSRRLRLHNNAFVVADPLWGAYSSSVTDPMDFER